MAAEPGDIEVMRYLSGDCSPPERAAIEAWLAAEPSRRALMERLRAAWNPPAAPPFDPGDVVRNRLRAQVSGALRPAARPPAFSLSSGLGLTERAGWRRSIAWIAGLAAVLSGAVGLTLAAKGHRRPAPATVPEIAPAREFAAPRGERAAFMLSDGTRVTLDAESRLQVPISPFSSADHHGDREVFLIGRAYFQVVHDSTRPFRVRTATGVIEDLGTEFIVAAFPEQRRTEVVVVRGAVAVRSQSAPKGSAPIARLGPGAMARVDSGGVARLSDRVDVARYLAWTEGRHVFNRTRFAEAVAELERWYDVTIKVADAGLLERRLTASFGYEPLPRVLEVLSVALDLRVERVKDRIIFYPRTATSGRP